MENEMRCVMLLKDGIGKPPGYHYAWVWASGYRKIVYLSRKKEINVKSWQEFIEILNHRVYHYQSPPDMIYLVERKV